MSRLSLLWLSLAVLLALTACGKQEETATTPPELTAANPLLAYVPADTPYLLANLEPPPEEVIEVYLERMRPVLDAMQAELSRVRSDLEPSPAAAAATQDEGTRFARALLAELDGKLSREGLNSLGLDIRSHQAVYGLGAFPVVRIGLSDPDALRAAIDRVLLDAGITAPPVEFQGRSFWRLNDGDPDAPVGLYLAVLNDHLAAGVLPSAMENDFLPRFLGLQLPADSDAATRLAELNRTHGYTPYGTGILDLQKLADRFLQAGTPEAQVLAAIGEHDPATLSAACLDEFRQIIANTPRVTVGNTELDATAIAIQYRVETPADLATRLADLVPRLPAIEFSSERALEFAFGMKFGPAREFLREKTAAIVNDPYQCERLQDLNDSAREAQASLEQAMPPFVNNFRGLRLSLSDLVFSSDALPQDARGHVAVHVEQPQMFVGMAQMFLPDLSELSITPGDPPVQLPESLLPVPGMIAFAAMSSDAIGLAVGESEERTLPDFLERKPGPAGTFLAASYDMAKYLDYTMSGAASQGHDGPDNPESTASDGEIHRAADKAFRSMAERNSITLKFADEGLVADSRMTFKQ